MNGPKNNGEKNNERDESGKMLCVSAEIPKILTRLIGLCKRLDGDQKGFESGSLDTNGFLLILLYKWSTLCVCGSVFMLVFV